MVAKTDERTHVFALNADVVGYSRLIADDFDTTTATMAEYHDLVSEAVTEASGTLPQFVGDNFMALFDTVQDAVYPRDHRSNGFPPTGWPSP